MERERREPVRETVRESYEPERRGVNVIGIAAAVIIIIVVAALIWSIVAAAGSARASTQDREKLDGKYGYQAGSIVDDLGWLDSTDRMNQDLRAFYNKTGVQPYIYLAAGHADLNGDGVAQTAFANAYYESHCPNEACALLVYFDTGDPYEDGDAVLVYGREAGTVLDDEAMSIFWSYLDQYWVSDMSEQEMFTEAFLHTGNRIMTKSATPAGVMKWAVIAIIITVVITAAFKAAETKRAHERQRNQETAAILGADIHVDPSESDDLLGKWSDPDT